MTEEETAMPLASKIANNEIMTAIARVAMVLALPLLTIGGTITTSWLENKFDLQETRIEHMRVIVTNENINAMQRISALETRLSDVQRINERLVQLETRQAQDAKNFDAFQMGTTQKLDRIQDSVSGMSSSIATLTAILQALSERDRRDRFPLDNIPPSLRNQR